MLAAGMGQYWWVLVIIGIVLVLVFAVIVANVLQLWVRALASNAYVSLRSLIGMKFFRRIDPRLIVNNRIKARNAGLNVEVKQMEHFYLARGNVDLVINAAVMAYKAGLDIELGDLESLYLEGGDVNEVIGAMIIARKGGLDTTLAQLESHHLAGGSVHKVVTALIAANRANIELDFATASGIDLAAKDTGREVDVAVKQYVTPVIVDCPDATKGKDAIAAVALDGIQMRA
jgi:uncharacterized protein YqfA (UPF0365 family)